MFLSLAERKILDDSSSPSDRMVFISVMRIAHPKASYALFILLIAALEPPWKFASLIEEHVDTLGALEAICGGKPVGIFKSFEIPLTAGVYRCKAS